MLFNDNVPVKLLSPVKVLSSSSFANVSENSVTFLSASNALIAAVSAKDCAVSAYWAEVSAFWAAVSALSVAVSIASLAITLVCSLISRICKVASSVWTCAFSHAAISSFNELKISSSSLIYFLLSEVTMLSDVIPEKSNFKI